MAALTAYTSYAQVRAALGVSDLELPDEDLALPMYVAELEMRLSALGANALAQYATGKAAGAPANVAQYAAMVDVLSPWLVADIVLPSLPLRAPKTISDGKAEMSRFADAPYKETARRIADKVGKLTEAVRQALDGLSGASPAEVRIPAITGSGRPNYDPVVG